MLFCESGSVLARHAAPHVAGEQHTLPPRHHTRRIPPAAAAAVATRHRRRSPLRCFYMGQTTTMEGPPQQQRPLKKDEALPLAAGPAMCTSNAAAPPPWKRRATTGESCASYTAFATHHVARVKRSSWDAGCRESKRWVALVLRSLCEHAGEHCCFVWTLLHPHWFSSRDVPGDCRLCSTLITRSFCCPPPLCTAHAARDDEPRVFWAPHAHARDPPCAHWAREAAQAAFSQRLLLRFLLSCGCVAATPRGSPRRDCATAFASPSPSLRTPPCACLQPASADSHRDSPPPATWVAVAQTPMTHPGVCVLVEVRF